jgi:hypothetical protein
MSSPFRANLFAFNSPAPDHSNPAKSAAAAENARDEAFLPPILQYERFWCDFYDFTRSEGKSNGFRPIGGVSAEHLCHLPPLIAIARTVRRTFTRT